MVFPMFFTSSPPHYRWIPETEDVWTDALVVDALPSPGENMDEGNYVAFFDQGDSPWIHVWYIC